jgi:tRNA(Ile)-lysidine synthase
MAYKQLLKSFQQFISQNHLIKRGEKIIVSFSGGIDSMTLLDLMLELSKRMKLTIAIAHFNHQLRGKESDEDEAFVREIAKKKKLRCFIENADTLSISEIEKKSIQETARNLRYNFLSTIRKKLGYDKIATAHNADDNTETILFNVFRGTGVHGMTGIPVFRKDLNIIRPLLFASRDEIVGYAGERDIIHREDSSNIKTDYTRNFIRHNLLPLIRENINPNIRGTLLRSTQMFSGIEQYVNHNANIFKKNVIKSKTKREIVISRAKFLDLPQLFKEQLLYQSIREFCKSDIDYTTVTSMLKIFDGQSGSYSSVSGDVIILRDRGDIIIQHWHHPGAFIFQIRLNAMNRFHNFTFKSSKTKSAKYTTNPNIEIIDSDLLGKDVHIRSWHEGDWFTPFGMKTKKKLSDFFIDKKIPLFKKLTVPILESDNNIVWVCGMRLDNRFRVTKNTKNILKLEFKMINKAKQ